MSRLPVPFFWGPVGGGEVTPRAFYSSFGASGLLYEALRDLARFVAHLTPVARHNARNATIALATTEETARSVRKLGARNVRVMSAIRLSMAEFDRLKDIPIRDGNNLRVLSAGRILHFKGFYLSVKSFALLLEQHPDSEFWIAGEGPDKKRCQRIAKGLGIQDRIRWCGQVPRDRIYELLTQSDVLLHPSLHESGGLICLEAMAAGRPVICFDLSGPGLMVTAETGIKVPAISPERGVVDLAKALSRLAAEKELCHSLGKAARKHVQDNFTWSPASSAAGQLYLEALPEGSDRTSFAEIS
jgi:glycosyltransferase involved in cell wall biosynthesis